MNLYSQFNTSQFILLGKQNYAAWKLAMQALLRMKDLWGCIVGIKEYTEDVRKDAIARTLIILSIEAVNYRHVQDTRTAKEAWDKLALVFGGSGLAGKIALLKGSLPVWNELISYDSVEEYIQSITQSLLNLRDLGVTVDDEWIGLQLLAGLSPEYWPLVIDLDTSNAIITGSTVKEYLLNFHYTHNIVRRTHQISPVYSRTEEKNSVQPSSIPASSSNPLPTTSQAPNSHDDHWTLKNVKEFKDWYNNFREHEFDPLNCIDRSTSGFSSGGSSGPGFSPCTPIKKDELEVEVRGEYGGFYEAYVSDVFEYGVELVFGYKFQQKARVSFEDVRLPPKTIEIPELEIGNEIEVFTRFSPIHPGGWFQAVVDGHMDEFVILNVPLCMGSKFGHGACVEIDRIRVPNRNPPIDEYTFHKREIRVPIEQRESAQQHNIHKNFQNAIGAAICRYVPERGVLLLISRNANLRTLGSWLEDFHARKDRENEYYSMQLRSGDEGPPLLSNNFERDS